MNAGPARCFCCGCSRDNPCPQGCSWNSPGLCTSCAGLGIMRSNCPNDCRRPIVWCETVNKKRMAVDFRPPDGVMPDYVVSAGQNGPSARHAHPEYIKLQVVRGGPLRAAVSHFPYCPNAEKSKGARR